MRACYAALRMQDAVRQYAGGIRRSEGIPLQIRVGLNSGEVVVRSIGSDLHMDYTAVGQTTHLAARMEQLAVPGSIMMPADTLSLAEGYVHVKPLGPLPIKGLPAPIEVYEVVGATTVRSRLQAAAARGSPASWGVTRSWTSSGRPWSGPAPGTVRWWPSSATPASASRASSGSSPTRTAPRAG